MHINLPGPLSKLFRSIGAEKGNFVALESVSALISGIVRAAPSAAVGIRDGRELMD